MTYSFLLTAAPLAVLGVPGSFGRYAEHYRQRGHLRTFLNRVAVWTAVCGGATLALMPSASKWLAQLVFGRDDNAEMMSSVALCLVAVILMHTVTSLLAGLRLFRIVSVANFVQSILFATVSLTILWRQPSFYGILVGYGVSCLVAAAGALAWAWPALREIEAAPDRLPHGPFWNKLLRFAFFIWLTNLLTNLFVIVDRYMLVHCAGMTPDEALTQVGHYHSSRIIPLLLVSVADLLSGLVMPHLSHDWERGRKDEVAARLNMTVKLTAAGMLLAGLAVLASAPMLFHVVLQGRYDQGLAVLPWSLAGCVWYDIYAIAQNYLWCAERTKLATVPIVLALVANILLNLFLLPIYGLYGAALSTAIATGFCLAIVLVISRPFGMQVDRGTWILAAAPAVLGLGIWPATAVCVLLAIATVASDWILTANQRHDLKQFLISSLRIGAATLRRRRAVASP